MLEVRLATDEGSFIPQKYNKSDQKATTHFGIFPRNKWLGKNGKPLTAAHNTSMPRSYSPGSGK